MFDFRYSTINPSTELASLHDGADTTPLKRLNGPTVGKPRAKPLLNILDVFAVLASIASLIASICVITPDRSLSWRLGFEGQIIVIGFLLSIMNLCMMRVAPTLFLVLEARWGKSSLQNYESLLRNSITLSHTQLIWRITLFSLIVLPLGLSIAYKRFTGGNSTVGISAKYPGYYGVAPPPMGSYHVIDRFPLYLSINASVPFLDASSNDSIPLPLSSLPKAYGFNTLLIDNTSAALFDVPVPLYVSSIQQNITNQESWTLSASVNATVARYDVTSQDNYYNDTSWGQLFNEAGFLSSYQLFQPENTNLGMIIDQQPASSGNFSPYCLLNYYSSPQGPSLKTFEVEDRHSDAFRKSLPMKFDIQRETCTGTWEITKTSFRLLEGSCPQMEASHRSLTNTIPFYLDALPVMYNTLRDYSPQGPRNASHWRMPAIVTSVATIYWAHSTFKNRYLSTDYINNPELYYPATNETIFSTNVSLNSRWPLYLVLCLQPILTVSMFFFALILYDTPIDKGFGLVAILSGIDKNSLDILKGAALSGELRRPVNLNVAVLGNAKEGVPQGRINYSIGHRRQEQDRLKRGVKYQ